MKKILLIFLSISVVTCISGQSYPFRHLTTAEGLLSDLGLTMTEDRLGRLWIASDEGINIFDGNKLDHYGQSDNSDLISNNIRQIFCDKQGTIWIKSNAGIQYKKETDSKFRVLPTDKADIRDVRFFGQTTSGILICVTSNTIYTVNKQLEINTIPIFSELLNKYGIPSTFDHFEKEKWFIGFNNKLVLIDVVQQKVIKEYEYTKAWATCKINDSTALVGSFVKDSVGILNILTGKLDYINNYKTSDGLPIAGFLGTIVPMGGDKFALGCRFYGVYILDIKNKYAIHLMDDPADPSALKNRFCRRLYITKSGTLFVHTRGISYTSVLSKPIQSKKYLVSEKGEKYDGGFNDFVKDTTGNIWIATGRHLAKWNRKTGISTYYSFYDSKNDPQKFRTVRSVTIDKSGRLWAGSFGGGLGMLLPDGSYKRYLRNLNDSNNSITNNDIYALVNDNQDNIFICCNNGFALLNTNTQKITAFYTHPTLKKIAKNTTFHAIADNQNNWWLAQTKGLYYYDKIRDTLYEFIRPGNLIDKSFQCIAMDSNGDVYAGNVDGLFIIKHGTFQLSFLLGKKEGLSSNNIKALQFDQQGLLWVVTNTGLSRYNPNTKSLINLGAEDGVETSNHNFCNPYLAPDGEMFVGSAEGFNYFYPQQLKINRTSLKVFISSIDIQDSIINNPDPSQLLLLKNYQNSLSISFLSADFDKGHSIQYRYKLIGLDSIYTFAGEQRQAKYSNLGPGNYIFKVEASSDGKNWYAANNLQIKVQPTFWTTWWFRLIILSLLWTIIYVAYKYRINQLNKQARLRTDYEVKLSELEMSALRTQMNPHFIFNSLNTINSFINRNNSEQANIYITKFARLLRLILDHSRKKKITLQEELHVVELYIQMEQIRFENKFFYSISIDDTINAENTEVPPLIIQPFVENSILHGLLPSKLKGLLKVTISKQGNNKITCTIYDNGIGRINARTLRNTSVNHKSHGMEITLKRIELFNKEHNLQEEEVVKITDLENPNGTQVIISLAYSESY